MSNPDWMITAEELKKILATNKDSIVLLDVREQDEFEESHIKGCILIPLDEVSTRGPKELNKQDDIVIYCAHGVRSLNALMALKMAGFEKLRSLEGGICAFQGTE